MDLLILTPTMHVYLVYHKDLVGLSTTPWCYVALSFISLLVISSPSHHMMLLLKKISLTLTDDDRSVFQQHWSWPQFGERVLHSRRQLKTVLFLWGRWSISLTGISCCRGGDPSSSLLPRLPLRYLTRPCWARILEYAAKTFTEPPADLIKNGI